MTGPEDSNTYVFPAAPPPPPCGHLHIAPGDPVAARFGMGAVALRYTVLGLAVFPLKPGTKVPATENGFHDATRDPAVITSPDWWGTCKSLGVGVPTGRVNNLLVIDLDRKNGNDGPASFLAWLAERELTLPDVPYVPTPLNNGRHLWFLLAPGAVVPTRRGALPGVDIQSDGAYVVVPPTHIRSRPTRSREEPHRKAPEPPLVPYTWYGCPCQAPLAPPELLDALGELRGHGKGGRGGGGSGSMRDLPPLPRVTSLLKRGVDHPHDDNLSRLAGRLYAQGKTEAEAYETWQAVVAATPTDPDWPYEHSDFLRHWKGPKKKKEFGKVPEITPDMAAGVAALTQQTAEQQTAQQEPAELTGTVVQVPQVVFPKTGLNALRAANWVIGQGPLMWGIDNQLWAYQHGVWVPGEDPAGDIVHARCARLLGGQYRQAHESNTKEMIRAQVRTLRCDSVPDVINFRDGLVRWREDDNELHPHDQGVLSTVQLAVNWNPEAQCPKFDKFLAGVLAEGDVNRMWEVIGYLMMSGNPLHKIFLLYGRGFNGKGTLLRVITAMLGEASVSAVSLHSLADERFTRAGLVGKLANICGDIDATYIERTGLLKQLTGEDLITAEHKFRKPLQFTNWAKPVFSANAMPTSSDTSPGWRKRWEVFSFPKVFAPDPAFEQALMTWPELEGIAANGVKALRALMSRRPLAFPATTAGEDARKQFAASQDPLGLWLSESTSRVQGAWTDQRHAHRDYKEWCEASANRFPIGKLNFYTLMRERFANTVRDGYPGFEGLQLRSGPQSGTQRNDLPYLDADGQVIYPAGP